LKEGENMKVNGKSVDMNGITTISSLLSKLDVNEEKVVLELNKEIVPRENYWEIYLKEEDIIEVISFVGGG